MIGSNVVSCAVISERFSTLLHSVPIVGLGYTNGVTSIFLVTTDNVLVYADLCRQPKPNLNSQNSPNSECGYHGFQTCAPSPKNTQSRISSYPTDLAPSNFTTTTKELQSPLETARNSKPASIAIPVPTLFVRDINRISTPLCGRGDRKTHLFPFSRSPSPRQDHSKSSGKCNNISSNSDSEDFFGRFERARSASPASSASGRSTVSSFNMHNESISVGRYPTSPLSPKPSTKQSLSPQNSQRRGNHGRQASRNIPSGLGRFHPSNFSQPDSVPSSSAAMQAPQITYSRAPPTVLVESPRLLREKHREFLEKAKLSSKLAASPLAIKPDAPRLDPLGSPKGPVTPLALEEANDYFSVAGAGRISPAASPGTRSPRSRSVSDDEDVKPNKNRKLGL